MLTKGQLEYAAKCPQNGLCTKCEMDCVRTLYNGYFDGCISEAAQTALAYREEIDRLKKKLNAVLQDFYQYVQGGKEICAFCLHDYECEPGEAICGATYKGFKWRGLNEREGSEGEEE